MDCQFHPFQWQRLIPGVDFGSDDSMGRPSLIRFQYEYRTTAVEWKMRA
jgi:hypothetical protein